MIVIKAIKTDDSFIYASFALGSVAGPAFGSVAGLAPGFLPGPALTSDNDSAPGSITIFAPGAVAGRVAPMIMNLKRIFFLQQTSNGRGLYQFQTLYQKNNLNLRNFA